MKEIIWKKLDTHSLQEIKAFFKSVVWPKSVIDTVYYNLTTIFLLFLIWYVWILFVFTRSTRLASFPDYLFIQLKKFTLGDDWVPKKLGKF